MPPPPPPPPPPAAAKRKKWTEEEERTLISKYANLQADGTLSRLRTREKKFRPIADHVTAFHHAVDPTAYPFPWTWKDACTKVQNMRHQYLLVKQKLIAASVSAQSDDVGGGGPDSSIDTINWVDGLSLWSNFIRYKQVFGDAPLPSPANGGDLGLGLGFDHDDGGDEGFDCDGGEVGPSEPPAAAAVAEVERKKMKMSKTKKKKKKKKKDDDRKVRLLKEREREWEERMDRRRAEWRKRVEEMLSQHRVQMAQIQARVLNEQQAVIGQLLGIVSHWAGAGGAGGMAGGDNSAHMNGMMAVPLPGENRGGGGGGGGDDGQEEDQFILDG